MLRWHLICQLAALISRKQTKGKVLFCISSSSIFSLQSMMDNRNAVEVSSSMWFVMCLVIISRFVIILSEWFSRLSKRMCSLPPFVLDKLSKVIGHKVKSAPHQQWSIHLLLSYSFFRWKQEHDVVNGGVSALNAEVSAWQWRFLSLSLSWFHGVLCLSFSTLLLHFW